MTYALRHEEAAVADLERLPPDLRRRLLSRLEALATDAQPQNQKDLSGDLKGLRSLRLGSYRAGYVVDDRAKVVTVWRIGHRSTFYKRLKH